MRRSACVVGFGVLVLGMGACGDDEDDIATSMATTPTGSSETEATDGATTSDPTTTGSDPTTGGAPTSGDPGGSETSSSGDAEWGFTITGSVEAEASGRPLILNVGKGGAEPGGVVAFNSASVSEDGGVEGLYSYGEDGGTGEHMATAFQVRLPGGGMNCGNDAAELVFMTITVADGTMESYDATFSGPVICEDGSEATVEGFLRQL
jgi:hypothetical protein